MGHKTDEDSDFPHPTPPPHPCIMEARVRNVERACQRQADDGHARDIDTALMKQEMSSFRQEITATTSALKDLREAAQRPNPVWSAILSNALSVVVASVVSGAIWLLLAGGQATHQQSHQSPPPVPAKSQPASP